MLGERSRLENCELVAHARFLNVPCGSTFNRHPGDLPSMPLHVDASAHGARSYGIRVRTRHMFFCICVALYCIGCKVHRVLASSSAMHCVPRFCGRR